MSSCCQILANLLLSFAIRSLQTQRQKRYLRITVPICRYPLISLFLAAQKLQQRIFRNLVLSGLPPVTRCNTAVTTSGGQASILVSDGSACHLNYCREGNGKCDQEVAARRGRLEEHWCSSLDWQMLDWWLCTHLRR